MVMDEVSNYHDFRIYLYSFWANFKNIADTTNTRTQNISYIL